MPVYTYRREDGTTFDYRQSFSDNPLTTDPKTGQPVKRIVQAAGVIFKGSGFYVNDSKSASRKNLSTPSSSTEGSSDSTTSGDSKSDKPAEAKKTEAKKPETTPAAD